MRKCRRGIIFRSQKLPTSSFAYAHDLAPPLVDKMLGCFYGCLAKFADARADPLFGVQRQRVGIARAVMQQPSLLLVDEPTSSLDPKTSVEIIQVFILAEVAVTFLRKRVI